MGTVRAVGIETVVHVHTGATATKMGFRNIQAQASTGIRRPYLAIYEKQYWHLHKGQKTVRLSLPLHVALASYLIDDYFTALLSGLGYSNHHDLPL